MTTLPVDFLESLRSIVTVPIQTVDRDAVSQSIRQIYVYREEGAGIPSCRDSITRCGLLETSYI